MSKNSVLPSDSALRIKAIQSLLIEKGLIKQETNDHIVDYFENKVGPRNGAKVVAKAWCDLEYKKRLLADGTAGINELGFSGFEASNLKIIENSDKVHNIVVCTLCSCYPWPVLGLPPMWFKTAQYRSRIVIDPISVLKEFGTTLADQGGIKLFESHSHLSLSRKTSPFGSHHSSMSI